MILKFNYPKYQFIKLLNKSIIVTNDDISSFLILFDLYKKIKHLITISEHWLCSPSQNSTEVNEYSNSLIQLTNYCF